ncbi:MAG: hypothetical protein K2Q18_12505 [Bdellovibrionales bacterium]|nr:hypothetical protein [Bdellovibrionales bacterium]
MNKRSLLLSVCLFVTLAVSSCANFLSQDSNLPGTDREISAVATSPLNLDELMAIKTTTRTKSNKKMVDAVKESIRWEGVTLEYVPDPKMSNDIAYKIVPTIEDQAYRIKIFHSVNAVSDAGAAQELSHFLTNLNTTFSSPFAIFELYYNAKSDDFLSMQALAKLRSKSFNTGIYASIDPTFSESTLEDAAFWKETVEKFELQERIYNKQIKPLTESRKAVMDALDKAVDDEQFRTLVAKNDRKGAAALLKKYLPWEEMPPFEKLFWENHLKIMVDPLPYEDRVLIYRGIDDDIVQVAVEGGKELSRQEAMQEQKMFLMSTMMTKNQGTWNRRLRSLTAMYEKYMGTDKAGSSEFTKTTRITNMFFKHSQDPKGSPFLSYSPKFDVASRFGQKRNTAYFLDPRMLYFNYASTYGNEIEFLLPIVSFPDDLAGVWDVELHLEGAGKVEEFLQKRAIEKLEKYGANGKGEEVFKRIKSNSDKYFKPVMSNTYGKAGAVKAKVVVPDGKIVSFFKKLLGIPTKKAADIIDEKSDMACSDLIQIFWK